MSGTKRTALSCPARVSLLQPRKIDETPRSKKRPRRGGWRSQFERKVQLIRLYGTCREHAAQIQQSTPLNLPNHKPHQSPIPLHPKCQHTSKKARFRPQATNLPSKSVTPLSTTFASNIRDRLPCISVTYRPDRPPTNPSRHDQNLARHQQPRRCHFLKAAICRTIKSTPAFSRERADES